MKKRLSSQEKKEMIKNMLIAQKKYQGEKMIWTKDIQFCVGHVRHDEIWEIAKDLGFYNWTPRNARRGFWFPVAE